MEKKLTGIFRDGRSEDSSTGARVLESVLEYRNAVLGLVLEYRREVLVLGLDLRFPVLGLDSYSAKAVLVPSLGIGVGIFFVGGIQAKLY